LVGYRWFDTKGMQALYPFGHGLSYTNFKLSDITTNKTSFSTTDEIAIHTTIQNAGSYNGAEVLQVYVSKPNSSVMRSSKELKAFEKVFLKIGESNKTTLKIQTQDLAYYSENDKKWIVEPGEYILHIATSSRDIHQSISIQVQ
jgi:beta-glucosidase